VTDFYRSELEFLRVLGADFASEHPTLAPSLSEPGTDPDVHRTLEGVAWLAGQIHGQLEADLPELTQGLFAVLFPHYLRPVPAMTVVELEPREARVGPAAHLPRLRTAFDSVTVDGTRCRFRSAADVDLLPWRVAAAGREEAGGSETLWVRLEPAAADAEAVPPGRLALDPLRLHLHGELPGASQLFLWLAWYTARVEARWRTADGGEGAAVLPGGPRAVRRAGLADAEAALPYPAHGPPGFRLLQEYFALPQRFLFLEVLGLADALAAERPLAQLELRFPLRERPPRALRVDASGFRTNCVPAVNLARVDGRTVALDHHRARVAIRADAPQPDHFEVFEVERVVSLDPRTGERREYLPFEGFRDATPSDGAAGHYGLVRVPTHGGRGTACFLELAPAGGADALPDREVLALELLCTNPLLVQGLRPGDVRVPGAGSPAGVDFRNLAPVSRAAMPPLGPELHARLVVHLALGARSLASPDALRSLLTLYNLPARSDRATARNHELLLQAIRGVEAEQEILRTRGMPVEGVHTRLELDEDAFAGDGELFLFASVLEAVLSQNTAMNTFHRLSVRGAREGEVYAWPARTGATTID